MAGIGFPNPTYARSKVEASERKASEEGPRPQDSLQKKWTEKWGRVTLFLLLLRNNMTDISIARTASMQQCPHKTYSMFCKQIH